MNRRHMTGDHHGQTAGRATLLARAMDEILGTHRCACEPGAQVRSYAELRLSSRPRARYQSRPGVPPSVARRFAATSPIASTITPARVRLSTAARAAAASMTSVITCCRRLASRASCRVADTGAGSADPMLIVISSRSPGNHLRPDPALAVSFRPLSRPRVSLAGLHTQAVRICPAGPERIGPFAGDLGPVAGC